MRIQKIISSIWKQSIEEFLIYRATSLITFILAVVFLLIELFVGDIYFSNSENANWTRNQYFILITFMNSTTYIYNFFFVIGHENLVEDILEGELDYNLIRPVYSYWYSIGTHLDIPSIFNLILSLGLLGYYLALENVGIIGYAIMLINLILTAFLIFLLNQLAVTLSFWVDGLTSLFGMIEDLISYASRPKQIFPMIIQQIFTFVIPVLLASNLPVEMIFHKHNYWLLGYFIMIDILLYYTSKLLWNKGIKHYSSAN